MTRTFSLTALKTTTTMVVVVGHDKMKGVRRRRSTKKRVKGLLNESLLIHIKFKTCLKLHKIAISMCGGDEKI